MIETIDNLANDVIREVAVNDLYRPVYIDGINNEKHQLELASQLPLFYVWKNWSLPIPTDYTCSLNGNRVSELVGLTIAPNSEVHEAVRNRAMELLNAVLSMDLSKAIEREKCAASLICDMMSGRRGFIGSHGKVTYKQLGKPRLSHSLDNLAKAVNQKP